MKTLFFFAAIILGHQVSNAQIQGMIVSYSKTDVSTKLSDISEMFVVAGTTIQYSLIRTGSGGKVELDKKAKCEIKIEQLKEVEQLIKERKLDATDSLPFDRHSNEISQLIFIHITGLVNKKMVSIRVEGSLKEIEDKLLYRNSMELVLLLRKVTERCR